MGEFGAVAAVSSGFEGGKTLPLYIERAYKDSAVSMVPAFAVSTLLTFFALLTLLIKAYFEHKTAVQEESAK
jgi:ABC-type sulfate transport system permease subunit